MKSVRQRLALALLPLLAAIPAGLPAQSTIFISRHADRGPEEPDAALTPIGHAQARALAALLADARITRIYTTELARTRDTAAPTARRTGVTPEVVPQTDFDGLIARIRATARPGEAMLVVGHRGTVPRIVKALTGQTVPPLGSGEYTRLIAVTLLPDGQSSVVTLRREATLPADAP